jgi:transcription elongation factor SPT6
MQTLLRRKKREAKESRKIIRKVKKRKTKMVTNDDGEEEEVTDDDAESEYEEIEEVDEDADKEDNEPELDEQEILKQAKRNDPYTLCKKYGLDGFAEKFGLTAENFGENLHDGYQKVDVNQEPSDPIEAAAEKVCEKFPKSEDVITAAKYMMATQIAKDPLVRKVTREAFFERATIDVVPTKKGMQEIDENHECYAFKYLKDKPVRELANEQWLKMMVAEEAKMIDITIAKELRSPNSSHNSFLAEAKEFFKHDAYSKSVTAWNNLRGEVVDMAFNNMLFPMLRKELRLKLSREAKDGVIRACRDKLGDWIKVGRCTVTFEEEDEDDWDSSHGCRVLGIMYENDVDVASYGVLITHEGEVGDFIKMEHLLKRSRNEYNEKEAREKMSDMDALRDFIRQKRPHCIVVGVADRKAIDIQRDVDDIVKELMDTDQFPKVEVVLMSDNLAKVFSNSQRAEQDFRDYPNVLRQAISLGRRMQDPLIEFSQLTGPENEILCLRFNPLQDLLTEDELLDGLNLEFINRTNEVGVDINECVAHQYTSNLVQFIGGLGPRKGAALLKTLRQMQSSQRLENRQQLVTQCHMGPKVLINCAGFIKIDTSSLGDSEVYVEVLDGSRIHNEAYEWARKMAVDALEYDEDDGNPANALEEILQDPEKLAELDLDAFAQELERQGFGKKHITLQDIRSELHHMYKDLREPYQPPDAEEVFNMVTKESPDTFFIGKLVQAVVSGFAYKVPQQEELDQAAPMRIGDENLWQCPFCGQDDFRELAEVWHHFDAKTCPGKAVGVKIRLDNGVNGFIQIKNLSDKTVINPEERVQVKQHLYARITKIQPERFSVDAVCKSSALMDKEGEWKPRKDDYYDNERQDRDEEKHNEAKKAKARQTYIKRVIVHPSFYNIGFKEAERLMQDMDQGDVIIRPSSKGEDRLTVTWKVHDHIYQHIDVREEGKANAFSLGQSLWIRNEEFEDLDEIIARHVNPMAAHARDVLAFKYYRDSDGGKKEKAEELLRVEKRAAPGKIHYFMCASRDYPGKCMLSYMPRTKARHELLSITPDGFRFRQQNFESLTMLMKWFKEHFRDRIPGTPMTTPGGRASGRTPYMTGTPGGGITPGAMSMATGTPYGTTPGGTTAAALNTPYTPSGQTPFMTPYHTPGQSAATPRSAAAIAAAAAGGRMPPYGHPPRGSGTPRAPHTGGLTPGRQPPLPPRQAMPPPPAGGYTPVAGGSGTPTGRTPRSAGVRPGPYPSPSGGGGGYGSRQSPVAGAGGRHSGGTPREADGWAAAADAWARGGRSIRATPNAVTTPRGYTGSTTPRYDDGTRQSSSGGASGESGSRTPKSGAGRRTPRANGGDATPLYDEH